jgi:exopolyphosphatase/guanosine-5'-triphosphate,3'-diphosphate pyrophosphatase
MKTIAAMDIGTNSLRMLVVRIDSVHNAKLLSTHKEVVRLGEGEFAHNRITPTAMERGLLVVRKFADIARKWGAEEIIAVATSAVREAQNRSEFEERALSEAGVDVRVVSGVEEARLIYLGIVSGLDMADSRGMFIDIGGGTTELIIGDHRDYQFLDSLKLGAIRLSNTFLAGETGPVSKKKYRRMLDYARGLSNLAVRKINEVGFDQAYGSSGTIMNLAEITAKRIGANVGSMRNFNMKYDDLSETIEILCDLSLEERRNVPGINPERADIILGGAAILDSVMASVGAPSITVSDRALREGIVIDYCFEEEHVKEEFLQTSARERSIFQLARTCHFEEGHAVRVRDLATSLFRQLRDLGLHSYGEREEDLLRHACIAHDIGSFVSHTSHHKHSYYLLRNWDLLGFDDEEIEIIATTALCHRKLTPKQVRPKKLDDSALRIVEVLTSTLQVADSLDISQLDLVTALIARDHRDGRMILEIFARGNCELELWALERKKRLFEQTFGVKIDVRIIVSG